MGGGIELATTFQNLLTHRRLPRPDGRPLYGYRFAREEYDAIGHLLRRNGPSAIHDPKGAALVVAYVAEWFRRERSGGHWDWIRPLRSLGFKYGSVAPIQYRDVEAMVSLGLRVWHRPEPAGSERLLAIVREAGFPLASVRDDPRISSWLKNSVLSAEKGFAARDAIEMEAWRVSDRLAQALFEPAIELCTSIVDLRASLPLLGRRGDPVDYLDQNRPGWRDDLPFDVEGQDVRSMVEQIVRIRDSESAALGINRYLIRSKDTWTARASLGLSGHVDLKRLPQIISAEIRNDRRVRIVTRPPFGDEPVQVGVIESYEVDGEPVHELRPFVTMFDTALALEKEARLIAQSGNSALAEFVPSGGEAMTGPVIALQIDQLDEAGSVAILRVLGTSPAKSTRPTLALAVLESQLEKIQFSDGYQKLGCCAASKRVVISFSGTASLDVGGARCVWRTKADRTIDARLLLVGGLAQNVREIAYLGCPQFRVEREGQLLVPRRQTLHWRPRGRGRWQPVDGNCPWGDVELAVLNEGEVSVTLSASILPTDFELRIDRGERLLKIYGSNTRFVAARTTHPLEISFEEEVAVVQLGPPSGSPTIGIRFRWDAEVSLTLADPSHNLRLIKDDDSLLPPRSTISIEDLKSLRLISAQQIRLCMELRANDAPRLSIIRHISGETPLATLVEPITQLLGSSDSLDSRIVVSAIGLADHITEIRWYTEDRNPFHVPTQNAFSVLAAAYGLDLHAIALPHPEAGSVAISAPATQTEMRKQLADTLPGGPWLIFGRHRAGPKIRPRILPALACPPAIEVSELELAMRADTDRTRNTAFATIYAKADKVSKSDMRIVLDLLVLARREKLPPSSIDALKAVGRAPHFAVTLLAACDTIEERAALLDLQRHLPFLWSSIPITNWSQAFASRLEHARARLIDANLDAWVACQTMISSIGDIAALCPELVGHARAIYLMHLAPTAADKKKAPDTATIQRLQTRGSRDGSREIGLLIARHDDIDVIPLNLLSSPTRLGQKHHWERYDIQWADIIAAPFAVAEHSIGTTKLEPLELHRCRDAWLFDPEYFEAIVPIAIESAFGSSNINEQRPR